MRSLKKLSPKIIMLVSVFLIYGCSGGAPAEGPGKDKRVLARIDGYEMTVDDFDYEKKPFLSYLGSGEEPSEAKERVLDQLINRQILLQEAQKMDLDKDKGFMREIENYWKQVLVISLLREKTEEFAREAQVTGDEIEREYERIREEGGLDVRPLEEMKDEIKEGIREEKIYAMMDSWISSLRQRAQVKIDAGLLDEIRLMPENSGGK